MKIKKQLAKMRECFTNHYEDLKEKGNAIIAYEVSSNTIWGGNGDLDVDAYISLNRNGWIEEIITTETGEYQKGDGVTDRKVSEVTDEYVEQLINGDMVTYANIMPLFMLYDELRRDYSKELPDW
ncbi:MAG: hypothetical protein IKE74_04480 [Mogibacterium sp.]|nr:hypothetical protein [Mogibacterium sp.]